MPIEIPIFPLQVVLFPGMQLPLHIFEPRYQLMLKRCLEGNHFGVDRAFGVALPMHEMAGQTEVIPAPVGCLAEITQVNALPDGRTNLVTVGSQRFRIHTLRHEDEYYIGEVEFFDDMPETDSTDAQSQQTRNALGQYLAAVAGTSGLQALDLLQNPAPASAREFSMWVAALLPLQLHEKQTLLETTSTLHRLQQEYSLLRRAEAIQRAYARRAETLQNLPGPVNIEQLTSLN
jgi:Lon protease-like protein